jgi:hypothetical protein
MDAGRPTGRHQARAVSEARASGAGASLRIRMARADFGSCVRAGSKPSRGYANPEGGRCRGVETPGITGPAVPACVEGDEIPGALIPWAGSYRQAGEGRGTRNSKDEPSGMPPPSYALAFGERPIGKTSKRNPPQGGSTEPNTCYRPAGVAKRRSTSKEDGHLAATRGRQFRGPVRRWRDD